MVRQGSISLLTRLLLWQSIAAYYGDSLYTFAGRREGSARQLRNKAARIVDSVEYARDPWLEWQFQLHGLRAIPR